MLKQKTEVARRRLLSRNMKGDYEFVTTPIGVIIFVGLVMALIVFVQASLVSFTAELKVVERDLQAVDAAHLVKACFTRGSDTISKDFLRQNEGGNFYIKNVCNLTLANIGAKVEMLEGPDKGPDKGYDFGYQNKGDKTSTHKIFADVSDGQKIYVARLSVSVSEGIEPAPSPVV